MRARNRVVALARVLGFTSIDHRLRVGPRFAKPDICRFGPQLPLVLIMLVLTMPRLYLRWCASSHPQVAIYSLSCCSPPA